ncbi:hypothetical protein [Haliangium sp.]|uniref:hypothetical protein n=1 Tax=Haliangium sp. TaxID=2663208 RepID=UPI003D0D6DF3
MSEDRTSSVHLRPETVSIRSRLDSDGDLAVEIQGEIALHPALRYERVAVEYTVRSAEGRVVKREDSYVDLDYMVDGQVSFSNNVYVKPPMSEQAASVEMRVSAQVKEVDRPVKLDIPKS